MARIRRTIHEERFSLAAIAAGVTVGVALDETKKKYWPLNEWELLNQTTQELQVLKNQNTSTAIPVPSGRGKAEDFENGISFTSLGIKNAGGGDTAADAAVLVVRKVIEEEI